MARISAISGCVVAAVAALIILPAKAESDSSYAPVALKEDFTETLQRMIGDKRKVMKRHNRHLEERYDLSDRSSTSGATMSGGKAIQVGVRVLLGKKMSWEKLASLSPDDVRGKGLWPKGFLPLPHPNHPEGGMLFPKFHIDEVLRQEQRDLTRFDLDFAMPEHFLPEFPAPIYLTTRKDLGDVSRGQLVTLMNYYELFDGILNPKQLEGLRLLVTPFPQQQFNSTADRRSAEPSRGVSCLDCHANGHTNAATHLAGDARPQNFRHRIDTPTLRGVNIQQLFGSQRALKSIEDFTEFEQRGAYFDGDIVIAVKKGVNILERGSQVHAMAEFQSILDFPPAPKLDLLGHLDSEKASESELRGQALFFGKAQCGSCHQAPYYTDNLMHDLRTERFFEPQDVQGRMAMGDGRSRPFLFAVSAIHRRTFTMGGS